MGSERFLTAAEIDELKTQTGTSGLHTVYFMLCVNIICQYYQYMNEYPGGSD